MRLLIISHSPETPSTKYRVLQMLPLFARDGIEVERVDLPDGLMARWALFRHARAFDVVLHQKRLLPVWQLKVLRRHARRLVYDFDDPMIYSRKGDVVSLSSTRVRRFRAVLTAADAVVASNPGLLEMAREHGCPQPHFVPTSVDLSRWIPREGPGDGRTIGWLGSAGNLPLLRTIAPALAGRRLRIVTDEPITLDGVDVEFIKWDFATEPTHVRTFDIAVAPLADDPWARGKMPFKILYYLAAGVPVVASRLGAVESVIRDGENGLVARTIDEWRAAIDRLASDAALRERLGRAGRRTVEAEFSLQIAYAKLKGILESLT
ncbi:MAG: glycosyltransferase [Planctomycetes bacterium]|nr:glycosyltransferase [Planctomycetota bacterium]